MPNRSRKKKAIKQADISRVMALIGSRGGRIGGKKRAENMTQEERSKSASDAAKARWSKARERNETK